jgi:4-amino-4-deoxy-L-arabinose transferase-like glycosyltransferase
MIENSPLATIRERLSRCLILAALVLAWSFWLFGRPYWTPDEPREAALAASMMHAAQPLPTLFGRTFAEKPPLTYWLAGFSMRVFGPTPAAARAPQLLYALLGYFALLRLGRSAGLGREAGLAAAAFASCLLAFQVQIWFECDALLLSGVCLALLGLYRGLMAEESAPKLRGYLLMHAGLTLAFFAKNFAGWLVPVTAFIALTFWERRWREWLRWELWAGSVLPLLCIGGWVLAVASSSDGAENLRVLFWHNLVGRAVNVGAAAPYAYATAHRNWPGKYFIELLSDLLPWTGLAIAALLQSRKGARGDTNRRVAWRLALCATVPALVVLSLAATARSIYPAPVIAGFGLLIGLWLSEHAQPSRATAWALRSAALLIAIFGAALCAVTMVLAGPPLGAPVMRLAPGIAVSGGVTLYALYWLRQRGEAPALIFSRLCVAFLLLLSLGTLAPVTVLNFAQNLSRIASEVRQYEGTGPVLLWHPDETTLAWAQLYLAEGRVVALREEDADSDAALARQLAAGAGPVVYQMPTPAWHAATWWAYLRHDTMPVAVAVPLPARLKALHIKRLIERPGGRSYLLLGP